MVVFINLMRILSQCIHGGSDGKESACNAGDPGSIPGSGRKWLSTPVFLPGEFHEQRSPVGYSPQSLKRARNN